MSERKLTIINNSVTVRQVRKKNMVKYGVDVISMCVVPGQLKHGESRETLEIYTLFNSRSQVTFILDRLLTSFGIKGKRMSRTI